MRRISALHFRAPWSRTASTLPAGCSILLELLVSTPFLGNWFGCNVTLPRIYTVLTADEKHLTLENNAMVFPVVMYGCESWTIKKAEHRRIDAFELWC